MSASMANQTGTPETTVETPGKRKIGRPTKYTPELLRKAGKYLRTLDKREELLPTIEGLSVYLGISRERIYQWVDHDDKKPFRDIYKQIMSVQGSSLIQNGLTGKYNAPIAKLLLSKHGYTETIANTGASVNISIHRDRVEITQGQVIDAEIVED